MRPDLKDRLEAHITAKRLFPDSGRALIAVSGGPDSVALALLLQRIAPRLNLEVMIGHVDHGIQPGSGEVAESVSDLAKGIGVPFVASALRLGVVSETKARHARYLALREMQRSVRCSYLITAHHADDQIETVVLRVLRGSGIAGLSGIPATGPGGLVRPLLPFRKQEIRDWLENDHVVKGLELAVHDDPSNADHVHDRSWVRTVLVPSVNERFAEKGDTAFLQVAANASDDRAAWSAVLREFPSLRLCVSETSIQVARETLRQYDPRLSVALLCAAAREIGCVLGPDKARRIWLEASSAPSGRTFELGSGWVLETIFQDLRIRRIGEAARDIGFSCGKWGSGEAGEVRWGEWSISWRLDAAQAVRRASLVTWATVGQGVIRVPHPGDIIRPFDGVGHRKVSRVLMEGRVPWPDRPSYPVLARGDDILWLPGVCRSDCDVPRTGERALRIDARRD